MLIFNIFAFVIRRVRGGVFKEKCLFPSDMIPGNRHFLPQGKRGIIRNLPCSVKYDILHGVGRLVVRFVLTGQFIEGGCFKPQKLPCLHSSNLLIFPSGIDIRPVLRVTYGRAAGRFSCFKGDFFSADGFHGGNSLLLPGQDIFPFFLCTVGQYLQDEVGDEGPLEVVSVCGACIQERHVDDLDIRPECPGNMFPLLLNLRVISPQTVDRVYHQQVARMEERHRVFRPHEGVVCLPVKIALVNKNWTLKLYFLTYNL